MKYNIEEKILYADNGDAIKRLECPHNKRWDNLTPSADSRLKRRCNECHKDVVDINTFSEEQVQSIVDVNPDVCFYISDDSPNIQFTGKEKYPNRRINACESPDGKYEGCRIIRTARSLGEINRLRVEAKEYHAIIVIINEDSYFKDYSELYHDGSGYYGMCHRMSYSSFKLKHYCYSFKHYPRKYVSPIAAYIVPNDVYVGERVFVMDVIEDHENERYDRLASCFATWDGDGFNLEIPEPLDFDNLIG